MFLPRMLLFVVLFASSVASADSYIPLIDECSAVALPGSNYMTPSGAGERLDDADGSSDVTISVEMVCPPEAGPGACAGLPFQDIWIGGSSSSNLVFCLGGNLADGNTNAEGRTRFTLTLRGGGWADGDVNVYWAGVLLPGSPLDGLRVNSPDINGDLVVNLADVGIFAEDYTSGYSFRSDFVADGQLNLADIGRFAIALGDECN